MMDRPLVKTLPSRRTTYAVGNNVNLLEKVNEIIFAAPVYKKYILHILHASVHASFFDDGFLPPASEGWGKVMF